MKISNKYCFIVYFLLLDFMAFAQPGVDDGTGGLEDEDPAPTPIDSKLIFLILLGIIFAFYTLKSKRKAN